MTEPFADGAILLSVDADVATVTLNRPDKRNALTQAMWRALPGVMTRVEQDRAAKVTVLTGAAGTFAAGADIAEFETVYATRDSAAAYAVEIAAAMEAVAHLSKPTIAAIPGACVGGGLGLALCCDLRIASDRAKLGITPGKLGLMYSLGDTRRLVEAVGPSAAKDILYTGRILTADQALAVRLIDAACPAETLADAVAEKASAIASASQWSARRTKAVVRRILDGQVQDDDATRDWFLDSLEGEDFREGRDAFLQKRTPVFPYR
ncbi:MAG: enoyl-CoA hydratase/isomerase family protein [Brevundimonas sp.]|uniref:enoyl-CoA hydratase/isomerase family protein n=1 Tax=Brevundimonas sp. TaxID=1871086 RepID=UPI0025BA8402|nr:enoyl-CoA hydratase-related protein [Brevundimonas sp.]MBX3478474.1 enoyl-CoA hydratase/isomerase family protein [Brevundimonas sp.]